MYRKTPKMEHTYTQSQKVRNQKKKKINMFIVNNSQLTPFNSVSCFNFDYLIACLLTLNEGFRNAKECVKEIFDKCRQWNVFKKLDGYFQWFLKTDSHIDLFHRIYQTSYFTKYWRAAASKWMTMFDIPFWKRSWQKYWCERFICQN